MLFEFEYRTCSIEHTFFRMQLFCNEHDVRSREQGAHCQEQDVRWAELGVRWSKQGVRWSEQDVRWSKQGVRWSEQDVRWSEQGIRCSDQGDHCHEQDIRYSEPDVSQASKGRRVWWASRPPCGASCATPGGVSGRSARDGRAAILHRALRRMRSAAGGTPTLPAAHRSVLERLFISGGWPDYRTTRTRWSSLPPMNTAPSLSTNTPWGRASLQASGSPSGPSPFVPVPARSSTVPFFMST